MDAKSEREDLSTPRFVHPKLNMDIRILRLAWLLEVE